MNIDINVYREITKQLKRDGFISIADELARAAYIPSPVTFTDGINISKCLKQSITEGFALIFMFLCFYLEEELEKSNENMLENPIQLELATQSPTSFNPYFVVDHQAPSSAVAFSQNGIFAAAGSLV
jgi:hypothetical protein